MSDTTELISRLQTVMKWELAGTIQYLHHAAMLMGVERLPYCEFFKEGSEEARYCCCRRCCCCRCCCHRCSLLGDDDGCRWNTSRTTRDNFSLRQDDVYDRRYRSWRARFYHDRRYRSRRACFSCVQLTIKRLLPLSQVHRGIAGVMCAHDCVHSDGKRRH